jgi:polyisoprenoid-binding protein YceI
MRQLGLKALLISVVLVGAAPPPGLVRLIVAADGNEARYRVREQLAGVDFPNDAVGVTRDITGRLTIGADGKVVPAESKLVVNVAALKSDKDRRDGYLRRNTLQSDQYPTVMLVPKAIDGLPATLPTAGPLTFQLVGDLTVRGVTKPTLWQVTAKAENGVYRGSASTRFTFDDFRMTQPKVRIVLRVADTIKLEYDFKLVPDTAKGP